MKAMELFLTPNIPDRPPNPLSVIQAMYLDSTCALCKLCSSLNRSLNPINLLQHEIFGGIDNVLVDPTFLLKGTDHCLAQGCFAYKNSQ
jgi:hypothetical protein